MPNTSPMGPFKSTRREMKQRMPMKICPDGSRIPANRMCPIKRKTISRAEQFKRDRVNKQRTQPY